MTMLILKSNLIYFRCIQLRSVKTPESPRPLLMAPTHRTQLLEIYILNENLAFASPFLYHDYDHDHSVTDHLSHRLNSHGMMMVSAPKLKLI